MFRFRPVGRSPAGKELAGRLGAVRPTIGRPAWSLPAGLPGTSGGTNGSTSSGGTISGGPNEGTEGTNKGTSGGLLGP